MHIAIDASSAAHPKRSGVAVYLVNLLNTLAEIEDENRYSVCYRFSRLKYWRHFHRPAGKRFRLKIFHEPLLFPRKADLFHCGETRLPNYDIPATVCAHADWIFDDDNASENFKRKRLDRYNEIARRGSIVVANSEATKNALIDQTEIRPEQVMVNYLGCDRSFRPCSKDEIEQVRTKFNLPPAYCVAVAAFSPRKNIERMLRIYADLKRKSRIESVLVLIGSLEHWKKADEVLNQLDLADRLIVTGHVPHEMMPAIYSGARMLLFPSLSEGFGLPLLESMACGTPVITANRSSMPEVAGDAGILVDPENDDEIADRIEQLDGDSALRQALSEKGIDRARFFTWERNARMLLDIWRDMASSQR